MVKIKTKKRMTPEEYAKYMIDKHGISSLMSELIDNNIIDAPKRCALTFELNTVLMKEISDTDFGNKEFIIEVEEEITEETKLDFLLDHFINPYGQHCVGNIYRNRSINDVLEENDEMEIATNYIHLFDKETKEFKLIWCDGKLI